MKRFNTFLASVVALLLVNQSAHAALIILGNLSQTNDGLGATVDAGTDDVGSNFTHVRKAVSFTMPAQSYAVEQVSLRLSDYSTSAGDVAAVGFYEDNGADAPGLLVGNLLNSPSSSSGSAALFTFTPSGPLTLVASTKYWLMLDATAGEYTWRGNSPGGIVPTSDVGAAFGRAISIVADEVRDTLGPPSFAIVNTVPEPLSLILVLPICGVARCIRAISRKPRPS